MTKSHREMTFSGWVQIVVHELVHICQQEVKPNPYGCEWFWEALALNLSGQNCLKLPLIAQKNNLCSIIGNYLMLIPSHTQ